MRAAAPPAPVPERPPPDEEAAGEPPEEEEPRGARWERRAGRLSLRAFSPRALSRRALSPLAVPAGALLLYTLLSVLLFGNSWASPGSTLIGLYGDPKAYLWTMEWGPFAVSHLDNPFASGYLNHPDGFNLMWNAPPLPGLVMWPVTAVVGHVASYNALMTLSLALSAWCMFLALRRITGHTPGSLAGGLFYGFSPYMVTEAYGHVVLSIAVVPPLMLLTLHELLVTRRWSPVRGGVVLGLLAAAQLMTFPEMLAGEVMSGGVAMAILALLNRSAVRERVRAASTAAAAALAALLIAGGPALVTLLLGRQHLRGGLVHPHNVFVNDLLNLVVPTDANLAPGFLAGIAHSFTAGFGESLGYVGAGVLAICAVTAIRWWSDRLVRTAALSAAAIALLSLGPHLHVAGHDTGLRLPAVLLGRLPLLTNLVFSRLALFTDLFVALLLAVFVARAWEARRRLPRLGGLAAAAAALLVLLPSLPVASTPVSLPAFFTGPDVQAIPAGSVALVAPWPFGESTVDPEVWQATSGMRFRMLGGYVFIPGPYGPSVPVLKLTTHEMYSIWAAEPHHFLSIPVRRAIAGELRGWGVRSVIVGPMPHRDDMVTFFASLLGRPPEEVGGVELWRDVDRDAAAGLGGGGPEARG